MRNQRFTGSSCTLNRGLALFFALFLFLFFKGCGSLSSEDSSSSSSETSTLGKIYIANSGGGDLLFYDESVKAKGNVPPSRRLSSGVSGPIGIFLDEANDRLYVANSGQNAILIFEGVSQITTDSPAPTCSKTVPSPCLRILSGPNSQINQPFGVFVDTIADRLYVANANMGTIQVSDGKPGHILIFDNINKVTDDLLPSGDRAPNRSLGGPETALDFPKSLFVDTDRDLLYVANTGRNAILIFANASTIDGELAPTGMIQPPDNLTQDQTLLHLPFGIYLDKAADRLYVANTGRNQSSILVFESASTRNGNTAPEKVLTGNTTRIADPVGIYVDTSTDSLYVTNQGDVGESISGADLTTRIPLDSFVVFDDFNTNCPAAGLCAVAPSRVVQGVDTDLVDPAGIVPTSSGFFYVANTATNQLTVYGLSGSFSPTQTNAGADTDLNLPTGVHYDAVGDRLFVANANGPSATPSKPALLVWENASKSFFNATAPTWWIENNNDGDFSFLVDVYISTTQNRLYLLNHVVEFSVLRVLDLSSLPANPTGALTFSELWNTPNLFYARAMAVDEGAGEIYVAEDECTFPLCTTIPPAKGNRIQVIRMSDGTVDVTREIFSDSINRPLGLAIDTQQSPNILYVANFGASGTNTNSILGFNNPAALGVSCPGGSCPADMILTGSNSKISRPQAIKLNASANRLFVANTGDQVPYSDPDALTALMNSIKGSILIFDQVSTLFSQVDEFKNVDVAPTREIRGTVETTGLTYAVSVSSGGIFVDTSTGLEVIYTTVPQDPNCASGCSGAFLIFSFGENMVPAQTVSESQGTFSTFISFAPDSLRDILYIASRGGDATTDDAVRVLTSASTAQSDAEFTTILTASTGLNNPQGIVMDAQSNRMFIANSDGQSAVSETFENTIQVLDNASAAVDTVQGGGLVLPSRTFSDPSLQNPLPDTSTPAVGEQRQYMLHDLYGAALDSQRDILYVSDSINNLTLAGAETLDPSNPFRQTPLPIEEVVTLTQTTASGRILVFPKASSLNNGSAPTTSVEGFRVIEANNMDQPLGVAVDSVRDRLYVAQGKRTNQTDRVYEVTSDRSIKLTDTDTTLGSVFVFDNASTLVNGNTTPSRKIGGVNFTFNNPTGLYFDTQNDILYVTDAGTDALYVFESASKLDENATPTRTLTGDQTTVNQPTGVAVDPSR